MYFNFNLYTNLTKNSEENIVRMKFYKFHFYPITNSKFSTDLKGKEEKSFEKH